MNYNDIVLKLNASMLSGRALRELAVELLDQLPGYDWSGIYVLDGELLRLDAYRGAATDHTEIPVGRGVCGSAVSENRNKLISDVREEGNYLACSLATRSEIVVLIREPNTQNVLAQIDIDSHAVGRFGPEDEAGLESIARILAFRGFP